MNIIFIQNKTGYDKHGVAFIVNGREYSWEHSKQQVIELPDGVRTVQLQMKYHQFSSPVYNFDLKNGMLFIARCHPVISFNIDINIKIFTTAYIILMFGLFFSHQSKIFTLLAFIAVLLVVYFQTIGRKSLFVIRQEYTGITMPR